MEIKYSPEEERIIKAIHIVPAGDDSHKECVTCWCEPQLEYKDEENRNEVWVHKEYH